MAGSPASFRFGDELDREIVAARLGGGEMDADAFADALGMTRSSLRAYVGRGKLPRPRRSEKFSGGLKSLWTADQVAGVLLARGAEA
jgi:hypothetical protein